MKLYNDIQTLLIDSLKNIKSPKFEDKSLTEEIVRYTPDSITKLTYSYSEHVFSVYVLSKERTNNFHIIDKNIIESFLSDHKIEFKAVIIYCLESGILDNEGLGFIINELEPTTYSTINKFLLLTKLHRLTLDNKINEEDIKHYRFGLFKEFPTCTAILQKDLACLLYTRTVLNLYRDLLKIHANTVAITCEIPKHISEFMFYDILYTYDLIQDKDNINNLDEEMKIEVAESTATLRQLGYLPMTLF